MTLDQLTPLVRTQTAALVGGEIDQRRQFGSELLRGAVGGGPPHAASTFQFGEGRGYRVRDETSRGPAFDQGDERTGDLLRVGITKIGLATKQFDPERA